MSGPTARRPLRWSLANTSWLVAVCAWVAVGGAVLAAGAEAVDGTPGAPRTEAVIVEAEAPAPHPEDPTAFGAVLEAQAFRGEQQSVAALVERSPGVQVRRFGGAGATSEISIRGSSPSQVVVLLDGIRLNSAQSGNVDLSTIPAALIERVEVSRGGGSVQTGSDAIGGVVNIVTRRASAAPSASAAISGASFGTLKAALGGTGRIGESEVMVGYDLLRSEGNWRFLTPEKSLNGVPTGVPSHLVRRVNNRVENHAILGRIARDFGDHLRVDLSDQLFSGSTGRPGPAGQGQGVAAGQSFTAHQKRLRNVVDLRFRGAGLGAGGDTDVELRLFHRFDRSRFREPGTGIAAPVDSDNRNHALGLRSEVRSGSSVAGLGADASIGIELREDWLDSKDFGDHDRATIGVFAQSTFTGWDERVALVAGLRMDWTQGFGAEWMPRLGLQIELLDWLRLLANAERSYRVPNFDELFFDELFVRGDPGLRPEEALNYDVGFELRLPDFPSVSDLFVQLALFRNDIDESIVFQLQSFNLVVAGNTGKARTQGIELGWSMRLLDWIEFSGAYAWLDAVRRDTGLLLPGRAERELSLRLAIQPPSRVFKVVAERHFTDSIPVDPGGTTRVSERTTYDLRVTLDLVQLARVDRIGAAHSLLLSLVATNLSDESVRDAQFFPQPGRSLGLGLEASW